jgi:hypothetical protein
MKRDLVCIMAALCIVVAPLNAQQDPSTSRVSKQHKLTKFQMDRMKQSEESILASILSESVTAQASAIQVLREMEQMAPNYPFATLIAPLADKLKNEEVDLTVRKLAALALDELHSEAGDRVINEVAQVSQDGCVKSLCQALLVRTTLTE